MNKQKLKLQEETLKKNDEEISTLKIQLKYVE